MTTPPQPEIHEPIGANLDQTGEEFIERISKLPASTPHEQPQQDRRQIGEILADFEVDHDAEKAVKAIYKEFRDYPLPPQPSKEGRKHLRQPTITT